LAAHCPDPLLGVDIPHEASGASTPFGVSAGRLTSFRVVSRRQIERFRRSRCLLRRVRFPAALQQNCWSGS